jgi:transcriptional regulator with XRE-family HTH domain
MDESPVEDLRDDIARRLDALREEKQWSLTELARRSGVKLGVLSALHTGARKGRNMKLGVAQQLCDALGAQVGRDLLFEEQLSFQLPFEVDLGQLSQTEKEALIIRLMAEFLQRGLQVPPGLPLGRTDDAEP